MKVCSLDETENGGEACWRHILLLLQYLYYLWLTRMSTGSGACFKVLSFDAALNVVYLA